MPIYSYTDDSTGETIEEHFPMGRQPQSIRRNGRTYRRDVAADWSGRKADRKNWPMMSVSLGCLPRQKRQFEEAARAAGVPTEFRIVDRISALPVFRSREHRRRYMQHRGAHDTDAGYGDRTPE